jgi:glycosyltransferase involved in cell wall biosynthesis
VTREPAGDANQAAIGAEVLSVRPRIAFVAFDFGEYCIRIANALAERADICLMLPTAAIEQVEQDVDPRINLVAFAKPRLRQPFRQVAMCVQLVRRVRRFRPDVFHLQQGHLWFNFALPLLRRYPLVTTVHDHRPHLGDRGGLKTPTAVMRIAFRRASALIVHSEQVKTELVDQLHVPPQRVRVLPHVAIGSRSDAAAGHPDGPSVLFFGRIWPYKGLEFLIRAEPYIAEAVPDVRIVIAGEGENFARYRAMMSDPGRYVVHNEFVSDVERGRLFSEATVVVLPYVEATQSGVVPVAYSFSKPVVATSVGGLPEAVADGETGYVVPPRDERALARAVVRLLEDPDLARRFGAAGCRRLAREASAEVIAGRTLAVYAEVSDVGVEGNRK